MKTLLVMSILLVTFLAPASAARRRAPRKALRGLLLTMVAAQLAYAFFLGFIFERLR